MLVREKLQLLFKLAFVLCLISITVLALLPIDNMPSFTMWDKVNHFIAFFVLTVLLYFCFDNKNLIKRIVLFLLSYGLLLEIVQGLSRYREFSLFDLLADAIGVFVGIVVSVFVGHYLIKIREKQT